MNKSSTLKITALFLGALLSAYNMPTVAMEQHEQATDIGDQIATAIAKDLENAIDSNDPKQVDELVKSLQESYPALQPTYRIKNMHPVSYALIQNKYAAARTLLEHYPNLAKSKSIIIPERNRQWIQPRYAIEELGAMANVSGITWLLNLPIAMRPESSGSVSYKGANTYLTAHLMDAWSSIGQLERINTVHQQPSSEVQNCMRTIVPESNFITAQYLTSLGHAEARADIAAVDAIVYEQLPVNGIPELVRIYADPFYYQTQQIKIAQEKDAHDMFVEKQRKDTIATDVEHAQKRINRFGIPSEELAYYLNNKVSPLILDDVMRTLGITKDENNAGKFKALTPPAHAVVGLDAGAQPE